MADQYYENIRTQISMAAGGGAEPIDILWAVADGVSSVIDGTTGTSFASYVNGGVQMIYGQASSARGHIVPNPWFVWNGHDEAESIKTQRYLKSRGLLNLGSGTVSITATAISTVTVADLGALAQHGNATGSTAAHIIKFKAIASNYKESETISGWMDLVLKMKYMKAALRGSQLAAAIASPIPWGGATAVSITAGVLAGAAKLGIKMKHSNVCLMTAMDLHWRAYQEKSLSETGPANRILQELFIRRGATHVFGQHHVDDYIREPGGWLAISDKLMLM